MNVKFPYAESTSTDYQQCKHKNGWFLTIEFWIFKKRIYVCSDCGEYFTAKGDAIYVK